MRRRAPFIIAVRLAGTIEALAFVYWLLPVLMERGWVWWYCEVLERTTGALGTGRAA